MKLITYIFLITLFLSIIYSHNYSQIHGEDHWKLQANDRELIRVSFSIYGSITNEGSSPVPVNETDLLYFDYPLETTDQRVEYVKARVNDVEYNYTIYRENDSITLLINSPIINETIKPRETISAGVVYHVTIDMRARLEPIADFYQTNDPYSLLSKAGSWSDLKPYVNETTTGLSKLWNYTHPLIKLLVKYLNNTSGASKPYGILLNVLSWFDGYVVYSTRLPPRHPWEVIVEGAGDCDDQSNLLITLLRSYGIPSYLESGMVYLNENYRLKDVAANGYLAYQFIGGGAHGWVATYIPPWGWIRVDPIVKDLGRLTNVGVKYALYYIQPTVVTGKVYAGDYVSQSVKTLENIENRRLRYNITMEISLLG